MKTKIVFTLIIIIFFHSCKKEYNDIQTQVQNTKGFFIVNEGNFTWGNSSLSFYDEQTHRVNNDIFYKANQTVLGDVAMDMKIIHNRGFIVVNNSGLIYVVDPVTVKHLATIGNLTSPRYILPINDTLAYVSDLYSRYITVIHTTKLIKYSQIWVGSSTEAMIKVMNKVFVTSWSFKEKVYVIDVLQHHVIDSIIVGKQPQSIVSDKHNNVWVLCDGGYPGNPIGQEAPSLWKINSQNHQVERSIYFPSSQYSARSLVINFTKDTLAFIYKHIYHMAINDTLLPPAPLISSSMQNFYTLWYHPLKPWLIVSDAKNYVANGDVLIYNLNGQQLYKFQSGVIPSAFCYYNK